MRRLARILSVVLITAGIVVLADVGLTVAYREPVSSIYGSIKQRAAAGELEDIEESYASPQQQRVNERVAEQAPDERKRVAILARLFGRTIETGQAIGRIKAPDMDGLDAVVVQGTDTGSLQKGPGHYPETSLPGEPGTVGIAGHRTTYLAPFRHIDSMRKGDPITVEMPYATFTYRVEKSEIVDPSNVGVVRDVGYQRLVLSACNPLYSAEERYIIYARLRDIELTPAVANG